MISFQNVYKAYAERWQTSADHGYALQDISFSIPAGAMYFLTGHSGAGKSTLLKLIAGLEFPTEGQIVVGDFPVHALKKRRIPLLRRTMGIVFQDNQLLYDRSVFDNVALPLVISGYRHSEIVQRTRAALSHVGLLDKADHDPRTLSGGEQQRIGIARAVINKPSLLIADEPTGNLDADMSRDIIQLFQRFNQAGVTVLIATHDELMLQRYRYPRLELADGQLVANQGSDRARQSAPTETSA